MAFGVSVFGTGTSVFSLQIQTECPLGPASESDKLPDRAESSAFQQDFGFVSIGIAFQRILLFARLLFVYLS